MGHVPNAGQLAKLNALKATAQAASAALSTEQANLANAQNTYNAAITSLKNYEAFIYGNTTSRTAGVFDDGSNAESV